MANSKKAKVSAKKPVATAKTSVKKPVVQKALSPEQEELNQLNDLDAREKARLAREMKISQRSANINNRKMIESGKQKIDPDLLTEPEEGDNEMQLALKQVYSRYFDQNPHRRKDNMEKARLLRDLQELGKPGAQYLNGVIIKAPEDFSEDMEDDE